MAHFFKIRLEIVIGEALTSLPDNDLSDMTINRLSRW
jgi:hypothetical protein